MSSGQLTTELRPSVSELRPTDDPSSGQPTTIAPARVGRSSFRRRCGFTRYPAETASSSGQSWPKLRCPYKPSYKGDTKPTYAGGGLALRAREEEEERRDTADPHREESSERGRAAGLDSGSGLVGTHARAGGPQ